VENSVMTDFDEFERRLAAAIRSDADASVGPFTPESIADAAIADTQSGAKRLPRDSTRPLRRFGRGRGITLLAAAAFLLVGGALAAGSGVLRLPSVVPPTPAPSFGLVATASPDATSPGPSDLAGPSASPIPAAGPGGAWIATGTMGTPRFDPAAVRLLDGRVLVVGGSGDESDPATAELYDPASGTWSATGNMLKPQAGFPPTLLLDGRVLVGDTDDPRADVPLTGAEVYDPASGTWSSAGQVCIGDTATLLRDGKVLVACQSGPQVYDADSGTWSATGRMITPRHYHTATLLRDGKVLVAGGYDGGDGPVDAAELYDPDTGSWTATANTYRDGRSCTGCPGGVGWATLLPDGTLLFIREGPVVPFAQIYDPATATWTTTAEMASPDILLGEWSSPALLSDGRLLVAGLLSRRADSPPPCTAAVLFDPRTGSRTTASSMLRCGNSSSFTLLLDGTVLVAGGRDCNDSDVCVSTGAAELYVPAGVSPPPLPAFPSPPPPVFPSPTPEPTPFPPAAGPVPPNARVWKVTVDNESSEPVTLSVAAADGTGPLRLVGSASPNVVPAGATVKVTFLFPVNGGRADGWICVDLRPGDEAGLVEAADIGIPGKIVIRADGVGGWLSP
jgi:Galactose oxidase, central domain/Kelch motif